MRSSSTEIAELSLVAPFQPVLMRDLSFSRTFECSEVAIDVKSTAASTTGSVMRRWLKQSIDIPMISFVMTKPLLKIEKV